MTSGTDTQSPAYTAEINQWRQTIEERLRAEDGWLALIGLYWLSEGRNTVGSDPGSDIPLPNAPGRIGVITLQDGTASFAAEPDVAVTVDDAPIATTLLRDDHDKAGPSLVKVGTITFYVIKRGDQYGVRARDTTNPARLEFEGRHWFAIDPAYCVTGKLILHTPARVLQVINSVGQIAPMGNPGRVEFELNGQSFALEAFAAGAAGDEVWFVFKDQTSGQSTYGAGRFMYAPVTPDGMVTLDFNKAYHPPCAFTPYATCPRPPQDNVLPVSIEAGERH
ncbi:MAG: hypothetical protein CL610_20265 [Anaerolineaceae bacterium]|nr:hypothetical protein [Anaerolineaceae bacterium]